MVQFIFSPEWFFGIDIAFETFSLIIAFLIARYGYKSYGISNDRKHKYFSVFFFLIGVSLIFKIIANYCTYYMSVPGIEIENSMFYFSTYRLSEIVSILGFSASRFLMMLSFFGLLYITGEKRTDLFWLVLSFIAIITVFSENAYYVFHITMTVLLFILFRHYYSNYRKGSAQSRESFLITLSFFMLMLTQVAFAAITFSIIMYVVGEIFQLAGFTILLYEYVLVTMNEK